MSTKPTVYDEDPLKLVQAFGWAYRRFLLTSAASMSERLELIHLCNKHSNESKHLLAVVRRDDDGTANYVECLAEVLTDCQQQAWVPSEEWEARKAFKVDELVGTELGDVLEGNYGYPDADDNDQGPQNTPRAWMVSDLEGDREMRKFRVVAKRHVVHLAEFEVDAPDFLRAMALAEAKIAGPEDEDGWANPELPWEESKDADDAEQLPVVAEIWLGGELIYEEDVAMSADLLEQAGLHDLAAKLRSGEMTQADLQAYMKRSVERRR